MEPTSGCPCRLSSQNSAPRSPFRQPSREGHHANQPKFDAVPRPSDVLDEPGVADPLEFRAEVRATRVIPVGQIDDREDLIIVWLVTRHAGHDIRVPARSPRIDETVTHHVSAEEDAAINDAPLASRSA
jgi:hypothetical protein